MAEKRVIELEIKTNAAQATAQIKSVGTASTEAATSVTGLGNASADTGSKMGTFKEIKNSIVGLVPGLKGAESGVMGLGAQFTKLLANPIVLVIALIVAGLKFVYEAFQSNVTAGKEIAAVWEGISAVGTQVKDATMGLVRAFGYAVQAAYKFITLDFAGAAEAMKNANGEVSESYNQLSKAADGTTYSIVKNLEKQQQANNKAKKEQAVSQSFVNKLLVQSRETLTDETASMAEKKKALALVTKEETKAAAERVRIAEVDLKILKTKAKTLGGQAEIKMKQEIRDATVALNEAETEGAMTGIKLNKQKKMLARQEVSDNKEAADAAKERGKENAEREKERVKERADTLKKIKELEQSYSDSLLSEEAKEIVAVQRKYKELYTEAAKHKLDITELKKGEAAEKLKIQDKYDQQINDKIAALTDTEQQKLYDAYQKEIIAAKGNKELLGALDADYIKKRDAITKAENEKKATADLKLKEVLLSESDFKLYKLELDYKAQQTLYANNEEALKALDEKYSKDKLKLEAETAEKQKQIDKAVLDQKIALQQQGLEVASQGVGLIKGLFEKSKGVQKAAVIAESAIGIAKMIIANKIANAAALATPQAIASSGVSAIPVIALNNISTGIGIAANIAATAKALNTLGGGAPPPAQNDNSTPTGGAPQAPQFNVVGNNGINQLAQLQQQPIQAYVVSSEMTSAQSLERNRINNATI